MAHVSSVNFSSSVKDSAPVPVRRKSSSSSTHSVRPPIRVRNPFRRRSSDSGGSSSEYEPSDNVPHINKTFDSTVCKDAFKALALSFLHKLEVPQWRSVPLELSDILVVRKIYGALTNTIYQITLPDDVQQLGQLKGVLPRALPKLLLRLYGAHVEHLIDRTRELAMLKRLSRYYIGPLLLGTFTNGRFEQWLDSRTLTRVEMRDPNLSCSIARRMRELHDGVKLTYTERHSPPTVWTSLDKWLPRARDIIAKRRKKASGRLSDKNLPTLAKLKISNQDDPWCHDLILGRKWEMFEVALGSYRLHMEEAYPPEKLKHDLAFCHNDAQYGNILRIENQAQLNSPDQRHRQLIVIDFEYASPNPRAYDLANHFCEWMYNYHSATPYAPILSDYPDSSERDRFLEAYIAHGRGAKDKEEAKLILENEIKDWRAVNHAFWCVWGVVMSEDDPELILHESDSSEMETQVVSEEKPVEERESEGASAADFDYIAYADQKMRLFWGELAAGRMFADYKDGIEGCKIIKD